MPGQDPNFTYRKPDELTIQLVDQLRQTWNDLPADARDEIGGLLEQARTQLVKAAGDASADKSTAIFQGGMLRAVALNRFLYSCESSAAVPGDIRTKLGSAHVQGSRGVVTISKDVARAIVAAIDVVWSPVPAENASPGSPSTELFSDPLGRAQKLTVWIDDHWEAISLEVEAAVTQALFELGIGLQDAHDDDEREAVALDFLRTIKAFAPAYELVANSNIYRAMGGGSGTNGRTAQRAENPRHPEQESDRRAGTGRWETGRRDRLHRPPSRPNPLCPSIPSSTSPPRSRRSTAKSH